MKMFTRAFMLVCLLAGITAQAQEPVPAAVGNRPDAPTYGVRGMFPVGTRDLVVADGAPLDLTLRYPALNTDSVDEAIQYPCVIKLDMLAGMSAAISGRALADATPDTTGAPYPLVVISPGFGVGRSAYAWLAEHLASHGFAVIALEHAERVDESLSTFWRGAIVRPNDISAVLDYAEAQTVNGAWTEPIDMSQIAVVGHSYGGYTALAMAGATLNLSEMTTFCDAAEAAGDPSVWLCGLILPYASDMATLAGLDAIPDGLWDSWGDARVDAIVPMAGDAYFFGESGLANVTVPVMALGGTADTGTPCAWGTEMTYNHVASAHRVRVGFENAEHMIFGTACDDFPLFAEVGFYAFCSDTVWDMDRAHDLISHFTTAFLLAELNDDREAAAALTPDAVRFAGVTYDTEGY